MNYLNTINSAMRSNDKKQQKVLDLACKLSGDKFTKVLELAAEKIEHGVQLERAIADAMETFRVCKSNV